MIKLIQTNKLLLRYAPDNGISWIINEFENDKKIRIWKTFYFSKEYVYSNDGNEITFILGRLVDGYFKIPNHILGINLDVFIHKEIRVEKKFFVVPNSISIFPKIDNILAPTNNEIRIGNSESDNLPIETFLELIKNFPTTTEINKYRHMRIDTVLSEYLDTKKDFEEDYKKYMNKKVSKSGKNIYKIYDDYELDKFEHILKELKKMLKDEGGDSGYNESVWQAKIIQIIRLLYPKYIAVFEGVKIKDVYTGKSRYLDFLLIDANGNVDIIEIKQPFGKKGLVTTGQYRKNHVPKHELSGTIMQVEKYIYLLNKWGKVGEDTLIKKYESNLPKDFKIKITNPSGMIIMGRDYSLSGQKLDDFELIKRKYKNIIDIITYDDLVQRLELIIEMLKKSRDS